MVTRMTLGFSTPWRAQRRPTFAAGVCGRPKKNQIRTAATKIAAAKRAPLRGLLLIFIANIKR
jgi:hypothetical protein